MNVAKTLKVKLYFQKKQGCCYNCEFNGKYQGNPFFNRQSINNIYENM